MAPIAAVANGTVTQATRSPTLPIETCAPHRDAYERAVVEGSGA
jgi:hypothetical protein